MPFSNNNLLKSAYVKSANVKSANVKSANVGVRYVVHRRPLLYCILYDNLKFN